ncbi:hypothetical protein [Sphingobium yanoikuyae]|uniref:hypothetical protein n=1 Tax=Sphingobium yanoikuyae TaxID=13690 RepID=UPI0028AF9368|nr:hypothetical protein [Sphingobium yanoikuyae]
MGRTLGRIIGVVTAPITLIDRDLGNLVRTVTFTAIGNSLGGPLGAALGATLAGGIAALDRPPPTPTPASSTSVKTSRPERVGGYGESRLYGAYILYETGSNGAAIDGYAVHDGPMTAPVAFYLGDDKVTHKAGVTYPGGLINGLSDGRYDDDTTRFYWTDGRAPGTTIPVIYNDLPGVWTANHRGDGVCLIYTRFAAVKAKNFLERYPSGVPSASMAAQWQKCPDPSASDPCDHTAWTWTENPIRQLMHYMLYREAPKPTIPVTDPAYASEMMALRVAFFNRKILPSIATWQTASNVCDEAVTLKAGGTEARYRSCLSHSLTTAHGEVKSGLLQLCDGWMATQSDGSVAVYAGKYYAPTVSIGPAETIAYDWQGVGVDDDSAVNEIVCSYVSKEHEYNSVECDAWRDEDGIAERGSLLSENLDLQTPSWGQVRRLAKRKMARANALYRGTVTTNVAGRSVRSQRYINLLIQEAGTTFFNGVAEVTSVTRNNATGGVTFTWIAADPNIDAWNPATEEGEPAAVGDRVAVAPLDTPTITSAVAELSDGGANARVRITVDGFDRDDITWYARWRVTTDTTWNEQEYSDIDPGASAVLLTNLVPTDLAIDVEVAYGVGDGRISPWSALWTVSTSTSGLAPGPVTDDTVTSPVAGQATITWRDPTSSNYSATRLYRNTTNSFGTASQVSGDMLGSLGATQVYDDTGLITGTTQHYWLVTVSQSGVAGSPTYVGSVVIT